VTIHGNSSVTANYTQNEYTLTITSAHGTVAKSPSQATYHEGDVVQLTATPTTGWSFANWTGDLSSSANPGSVTIHGNTSVTANYTQNEYTLTITSAHGTVAKNPSQATYHGGDVVQLTATPTTGWSFANWTGDLSSSANPGSVTIHGNTSVTANYTQNEYTLTITSAHGTVAKNPSQATYHEGDTVQLTVTPDTGWSFVNWTGGLTGTANPASITIHGNSSVTANYNQVPTDIGLTNSSVIENQAIGTTVGTLSTVDSEIGDTHTYSFCSGADDTFFSLAGNALKTAAVFDYETKNSYAICIRTNDGHGAYDEAFTITVTDIPYVELLTPANAVNVHTIRPTFDWVNYPAATGYNIQISKNIGFTQIVSNTNLTGGTNSIYTPTLNLTANIDMWWRVRAKLTLTTYSGWSEVRTFHTGNPPSVPTLSAPASNALVTTLRPKFDWSNSTLPAGLSFDHYQIQVSTSNTFASTVIDATTTVGDISKSDYTPTADLNPATTYYWRVRSWSAAGDFSGWSAVRSVRIAYAGPTLLLPANGAIGVALKPTFTWSPTAGATSYNLQVSKSSTFSLLAINKTVSTPTYTHTLNLAAGTTYYWRVRVNGGYGPGMWSVTFSFTTP
jgi:hypothetical protein